MAFWNWSRVAANNATAMAGGWPEGMAPSQVNDSARLNGSELACYRDDIAGAIVTTGTSTAYAVASYQVFDTFAHLNGQMIAFSPHATNGAIVTLNVDGLGAKPLRSAPNAELLAGTIIQGTPYVATYNNSDGAFYLRGFYGNPYNIPLLGGMDFWDTIAPNSSFIFPVGQAISRTTYVAAFTRWGTAYGAGDGATTFNVPDKRGRVSAMQETASTLLTGAYFGGNSTVLGTKGGSESHLLTTGEMPAHSHGVTDPGHSHGVTGGIYGGSDPSGASIGTGGATATVKNNVAIAISGSGTGVSINSVGGGGAHAIVQPTIICNYIIRVI